MIRSFLAAAVAARHRFARSLHAFALGVLCLLAMTTAHAQLSISDNNTHIDRGVSYTNLPFLTEDSGNGLPPYTFTYSGTLPAGIRLNSDGTLTGLTCASNGTYPFTASVSDLFGDFGTNGVNLIVNRAPAGGCSLTLVSSTIPNATLNQFYTTTLSATGGTSPYTYTIASGSLPTGVTLSSTGTISGTPTSTGTYTFLVNMADGAGSTGQQSVTLTVSATASVSVSPGSLSSGTVGTSYSATVSGTGGTSPYTYAVSSGSLPAGLSLNTSSGVLSGTPTAGGTFNFTVRATDASSSSGTTSYSLTISAPTLTLSPTTLPQATVSSAYSQTISTSGGTAPYSYAVTAGALPAGLSINPGTGALSGTPTASGTFNFTVSATDSSTGTGPYVGSRAYSLTVIPVITLGALGASSGTTGVAYSQTLSASGGTSPYSFALTAGALPSGLSLSSGGVLSGTPMQTGTFNFTVTATDAGSYSGSRAYSLGIVTTLAATTAAATTNLKINVAASAFTPVTSSGGVGPMTYSISPSLPTGLGFNTSTGQITGTPTATLSLTTFTVRVTDAAGSQVTSTFALSVAAAPTITISPSTLNAAAENVRFTQSLAANGGTGPYTFSVSAGALPPGITLSSLGVLDGTPTTRGNYSFTVRATDADGYTGELAYTMNVASGLTSVQQVSTARFTAGTGATAFTPVTAVGGVGPFTYAISPSLPAGLAFDTTTGRISGTPSASSPLATYSVTITDSLGATSSQNFQMQVAVPMAMTVQTASITGKVNRALTTTTPVTVTGGTTPYTYALSPALPAGLVLNTSTGAISGTPTVAIPRTTYTMTITDSAGAQTTGTFDITITLVTLSLTPARVEIASAGIASTTQFTASGGTAPYVYSLAAGELPRGLSLSADGKLSGAIVTAGTYTFTLRVTDADGFVLDQVVTLVAGARPDPTRDPNVAGVIHAQAAAMQRFNDAQMLNVQSRLDANRTCSKDFTNRLSVNVQGQGAAPVGPSGSGEQGCEEKLAFWTQGTLNYGRLDPRDFSQGATFTTPGVTFGADTRIGGNLLAGMAFGYGEDRSKVSDAVISKGRSTAASGYASYRLAEVLYVDGIVGVSRGGFDYARPIAEDGTTATGARASTSSFGALTFTGKLNTGLLAVAPYARVDRQTSTLKGYSESGESILALTYDDLRVRATSLAIGANFAYPTPGRWGIFEPTFAAQVRRTRTNEMIQTMHYTDEPDGTRYQLVTPQTARTSEAVGVGANLRMKQGLLAMMEYRPMFGAQRGHSVRLGVRVPF